VAYVPKLDQSCEDDLCSPTVGRMPPRGSLPPYRVVSADLRERIDGGEWLPGEQLPTVRTLAEHYGVSISTVQHALNVLRDDRLITVVAGWGVFRAS
jgi:DNA-binding GntR family transcriptional regulator